MKTRPRGVVPSYRMCLRSIVRAKLWKHNRQLFSVRSIAWTKFLTKIDSFCDFHNRDTRALFSCNSAESHNFGCLQYVVLLLVFLENSYTIIKFCFTSIVLYLQNFTTGCVENPHEGIFINKANAPTWHTVWIKDTEKQLITT